MFCNVNDTFISSELCFVYMTALCSPVDGRIFVPCSAVHSQTYLHCSAEHCRTYKCLHRVCMFDTQQPNIHTLLGRVVPNECSLFGCAEPNIVYMFGSERPNNVSELCTVWPKRVFFFLHSLCVTPRS